MPIEHVVQSGEYLSSIALEYGFSWKTLWNHGLNAKLKEERKNPNVLFPGDIVRIPDPQEEKQSRGVDAKYKFKRKGEQSVFRIYMQYEGKPRKNEQYILDVEGKKLNGTTDDDGKIEQLVPSTARKAVLTLGKDEYQAVYHLNIGSLDPVSQLIGIQQRLNNLGFVCGPEDGKMGPRTESAIRRFQKQYGLTVDGIPGPQTQQKLEQEHKS